MVYNYFQKTIKSYSFTNWIVLILFIKLILFVFYAIQYHIYPELSLKHGFLYVVAGDTSTYYPPIINVLAGGDYGNACRMPGLFPVFAPFYYLSNNLEFSYNAVIIIQFIVSTISVYVLGLISLLLFDDKKIFLITIILYSLFYHIGDHFLLADSLANSTLIFGTYFYLKSLKQKFEQKKDIFISGLFFAWSIFIRLIGIIPFFALFALLIYFVFYKNQKIVKTITIALLFSLCFIVFESAWVLRNKISLNRTLFFTVPECYSSFSYNWLELAKIPTAWGHETTPWIGEIKWWLNKDAQAKEFNFPDEVLTKNFTVDSLTKLKKQYYIHALKGEGVYSVSLDFKEKVRSYLHEYKSEHFIDYYVFHPLKLFFKFHYKKMIVDIPFPKYEKMSLFQKGFKVINWIVLLIISLVFLFFAPVSLLFNRKLPYVVFLVIPFTISFFLCFIMGAIEQRYFWPIVPFAIVFFGYFIQFVISFFKKKIFKT